MTVDIERLVVFDARSSEDLVALPTLRHERDLSLRDYRKGLVRAPHRPGQAKPSPQMFGYCDPTSDGVIQSLSEN